MSIDEGSYPEKADLEGLSRLCQSKKTQFDMHLSPCTVIISSFLPLTSLLLSQARFLYMQPV